MARPMPRLPPVTTATRPVRSKRPAGNGASAPVTCSAIRSPPRALTHLSGISSASTRTHEPPPGRPRTWQTFVVT